MAAAYILHQCEEFTVVKCIPADAIPTSGGSGGIFELTQKRRVIGFLLRRREGSDFVFFCFVHFLLACPFVLQVFGRLWVRKPGWDHGRQRSRESANGKSRRNRR